MKDRLLKLQPGESSPVSFAEIEVAIKADLFEVVTNMEIEGELVDGRWIKDENYIVLGKQYEWGFRFWVIEDKTGECWVCRYGERIH